MRILCRAANDGFLALDVEAGKTSSFFLDDEYGYVMGYINSSYNYTSETVVKFKDPFNQVPLQIIPYFYSSTYPFYILANDHCIYYPGNTSFTSWKKLANSDNTVKVISKDTCGFFAIKDDGTVYALGVNGNGCLGIGHGSQVNALTLVNNIKNPKKIAIGNKTSLLIGEDNCLYYAGNNNNGYNSNVFTKNVDPKGHPNGFNDVLDIAIGVGISGFAKTHGYSGFNYSGYDNDISTNYGFIIHKDNTVTLLPNTNSYGQCGIDGAISTYKDNALTDVAKIETGLNRQTFITKTSGEIFVCGESSCCSLGVGLISGSGTSSYGPMQWEGFTHVIENILPFLPDINSFKQLVSFNKLS